MGTIGCAVLRRCAANPCWLIWWGRRRQSKVLKCNVAKCLTGHGLSFDRPARSLTLSPSTAHMPSPQGVEAAATKIAGGWMVDG